MHIMWFLPLRTLSRRNRCKGKEEMGIFKGNGGVFCQE